MSKLKTIFKDGLDPLKEGLANFQNPIKEIEDIAIKRAEICQGCDKFELEPISFFRIKDERIPKLSNMMCGDCHCELSLKTRQNVKICKYWKNL